MTQFKVALSMGHTPDKHGAKRGIISEYGLTSAIIGDLAFNLDKLGHEAWIIGADSNSKQVEDINNLKPDFGLELHFNNMKNHPEWNGSLVMHSGFTNSKKLAQSVQNCTVDMLGTKDKGIIKGHYQLDVRKDLITIIKNTNCPFVVIEPLFLSNLDDFEKINIPLISVGILQGILEYWQTINK